MELYGGAHSVWYACPAADSGQRWQEIPELEPESTAAWQPPADKRQGMAGIQVLADQRRVLTGIQVMPD